MDNSFEVKSSSIAEAAKKIESIFTNKGYKLENGDSVKGSYGTGSKLMRILLGAFAKRFLFDFEITESNGKFVFKLTKNSVSNISGGMLGAKKYNSEYDSILSYFKEELSK